MATGSSGRVLPVDRFLPSLRSISLRRLFFSFARGGPCQRRTADRKRRRRYRTTPHPIYIDAARDDDGGPMGRRSVFFFLVLLFFFGRSGPPEGAVAETLIG